MIVKESVSVILQVISSLSKTQFVSVGILIVFLAITGVNTAVPAYLSTLISPVLSRESKKI